jgi:hypothetical protein
MSIKEELVKQKELILNGDTVDVYLFKVKSLLKRYHLKEEEAEEKYKILFDSWNDNHRNYGSHASLLKRERVAGLLQVMIEEIGDESDHSLLSSNNSETTENYIDEGIIRAIRNKNDTSIYKLDRLAMICDEINSSFQHENYFAVVILIRAIIDMIPPLFEKSNFAQVASNVSMSRSHKDQLEILDKSLRKYADGCVHIQLNKTHPYPNKSNTNFRAELSVLLEIVKDRLE